MRTPSPSLIAITVLTVLGGIEAAHAQCRYEVTAIVRGPDCPHSAPATPHVLALNNHGHMAGRYACLGQYDQPWVWRGTGDVVERGPLPSGEARVYGMNDEGDVVGHIDSSAGSGAFVVRDGEVTILPHLPGAGRSDAYGINNAGQIVGRSMDSVDGVPASAVIWENGEIIDLGPLVGGTQSRGYGVNEHGHVVGWRRVEEYGSARRAFILDERGVCDIGVLADGFETEARAISNDGRVVGNGKLPDSDPPFFVKRAFYWHGDDLQVITPPPTHRWTIDNGVNDDGIVIGTLHRGEAEGPRGFVWNGHEVRRLQDLVPQDSGFFSLEAPGGINDAGQIAVTGVLEDPFVGVAVLLTPLPPPPADLNGDCHVDGQDLLLVLFDWGRMDSPADLDKSGVVDMGDVVLLIGDWG